MGLGVSQGLPYTILRSYPRAGGRPSVALGYGWLAHFGAGVTSCMSCASFWTVAASWLLWTVGPHEIVWALAAWGAAILAHRATR